MAIARDTTAANIKPLEGAIVRRFVAGAAIEAGEVVSMSSDGYIDPANAAAVATNRILGIALPVKNQAAAYAAGDAVDVVVFGACQCVTGGPPGGEPVVGDAAGDAVDVVIFGAVQCVTGGTPGAVCYSSDTAGEPAETAGTKTAVVGLVIAATIVFVKPYIVSFS